MINIIKNNLHHFNTFYLDATTSIPHLLFWN